MTAPLSNLTANWTDGALHTGIKLNVTDTSSDPASLLMDLQVGSSFKFKIGKDGSPTLADGASLSWKTFNTAHLFFNSASDASVIQVVVSGNNAIGLASSGLRLNVPGGGSLSFGTGLSGASQDVFLTRGAAAILAQRNGVNAQASQIFETYTDDANNSMLRFDACKTTAGVHRIISEANGTGTKRPIAIDAYSKSGAPTSSELPAGTAGVFKDTGGGGVVIAYNDGGTIKTGALT